MAYEQNLSRGLQSTIDATPIEDGKLRFAVDTARLFLDLKNERVEFTDFIRGLTSSEIRALQYPLPKMYLASDTHELLFYHAEQWISFGGGDGIDQLGQIIHKTYIKNIKFNDNGYMIAILGDGETEIPVEDQTLPSILNRLSDLEEKYIALRADHEALVEAVTEWGEFADIPESISEMLRSLDSSSDSEGE